jgi:hypothetical protein
MSATRSQRIVVLRRAARPDRLKESIVKVTPVALIVRNVNVKMAQTIGVAKPHTMKREALNNAVADMMTLTVLNATVSDYVGRHRVIAVDRPATLADVI